MIGVGIGSQGDALGCYVAAPLALGLPGEIGRALSSSKGPAHTSQGQRPWDATRR